MRLSDAIREGCKHHAQAVGEFVTSDWAGTCAMGAAAVGMMGEGVKSRDVTMFLIAVRSLPEHFPILDQVLAEEDMSQSCWKQCMTEQMAGEWHIRLSRAIQWLNDMGSWSREAIAEWVATIEDKYLRTEVECEELTEEKVESCEEEELSLQLS